GDGAAVVVLRVDLLDLLRNLAEDLPDLVAGVAAQKRKFSEAALGVIDAHDLGHVHSSSAA
ncbi:MAG: hypothetical protein ACK559_25230, partial [bacterium]